MTPSRMPEVVVDPDVFAELRELDEGLGGHFLAELVRDFTLATDVLLLELGEAVELGDAASVSRIAHSIKGSAGSLGGTQLNAACSRLELKALSGNLAESAADLAGLHADYSHLRSVLDEKLQADQVQASPGAAPISAASSQGSPIDATVLHAIHAARHDLILIADDAIATLTLVSARLLRTGYEVMTATRGDEALALAREFHPQLVVVDLEMPGLGGIEVTKQLRADSSFADVPIIILTSHDDDAHTKAGLDAGADAYIVKPFSPQELAGRVDELLETVRSSSRRA
jgi:CheY-like chemotaxis protein